MKGNSSRVKVSTTAGGAGTYTNVAEVRDWALNEAGQNVDVSNLDAAYAQRIQGMKDLTWSVNGFWKPGDTSGQVAIRNAWLNDSELWVQVLPDGTTGFKQQVRVASFNITAGTDGAVEFSAELEGTGAVAAV